ncbi:MAG: 4-(cytidine 5'-diphospho)-2-C-methyl-D-erythritol kinase [Desulfarculaceae bacterium]|nr:4-(cytidine 5'-diphospho)-2-C-methyl-D-erythritol kinase [Desulfarculaceae bacterium]MCF8070844.1 4-(cytidine 5'-diphospho)-2-C-methyl-D-erythritol kinase [Desulfarculaceae bacterium]MCF8102282.1 4-(cytidine 5'-diphospho)-2-C-methyl-D-erythritol kinase [Desulfarculaceae bacterium]MCF8118050.1 4-(cytidine 5'-diphospho)-2-C-methyl-D-erythritol kinase [Desulfarculaceae bacterium]
MKLALEAPAKVNLHLRILGRRPDGYHDLATLMQPLDLADTLEVELGGRGLGLTCDRPELEGPDNLVLAAARAYYQALGRPPAARFHLTKRIPVAAGLGGGSSDAAAALLALNALHQSALPPERLAALAAGLGADVPFFLAGCSAWCTGIGQRVEPWEDFPCLNYVLVNPGFALSTAWVYQHFDLQWTNTPQTIKIKRPRRTGDFFDELLFNDLEVVSLREHPVLGEIKAALSKAGAEGCLMSGSGPTVFGVFADASRGEEAAHRLRLRGGWWVRSCQGVRA